MLGLTELSGSGAEYKGPMYLDLLFDLQTMGCPLMESYHWEYIKSAFTEKLSILRFGKLYSPLENLLGYFYIFYIHSAQGSCRRVAFLRKLVLKD
jgi:hypothetical protein